MAGIRQYFPRPALRALAAGGTILLLVAGALMIGWHEAAGPPSVRPNQAALSQAIVNDTQSPAFDVVRVSPQGVAVIAGTAAPGAPVVVRDGTAELGCVIADQNGQWVLTPDRPLSPGARELTLAARRPDGSEAASAGSVILLIPEPTATAAAGQPVAVLRPTRLGGAVAPRVLQGPQTAAGQPSAVATRPHPDGIDLDLIDYDDQGAIVFAGHAQPGRRLRLYIDDAAMAEAVAGPQARWQAALTATVSPGQHRVRVDQFDRDGNVDGRVEMPFVRESAPQEGGRFVVQPGANLWRIARAAYGSGNRYTLIFQHNLSQIRDPALIYPGEALVLPDLPAMRGATGVTGGMPLSSSRSR